MQASHSQYQKKIKIKKWEKDLNRHLSKEDKDISMANKRMKRCLLLEKSKSKIQWDITSHQSEWPSSKNLQTINAGERVEKREPSYIVGGNVNWYNHYREQYRGSLKNKNRATVWSSNTTLAIIQKVICTPVFTAALFTNSQDMEAT